MIPAICGFLGAGRLPKGRYSNLRPWHKEVMGLSIVMGIPKNDQTWMIYGKSLLFNR